MTAPTVNPLKTDGLGNYGFWAAPGVYTVSFNGAGLTPTPSTIAIPCVPNSTCPLASGISAINPGSLAGPTVTLQAGTGGTDFNLSGAANTLTLNLPTASATNRGALSSADWSTFNGKLSPFPNQSANTFYSGPSSGPAAAPTFRAMAAPDLPATTSNCSGQQMAQGLNLGGTPICASRTIAIPFIIDGGGNAIATGSKGHLSIPFACTLTGWTILGDQSGSIVVDVKRSTYSGFPTTASIAGTDKPTLSSAQKNENLGPLSAWTSTAISAGDVLEFNVSSATTVTRITVTLNATVP